MREQSQFVESKSVERKEVGDRSWLVWVEGRDKEETEVEGSRSFHDTSSLETGAERSLVLSCLAVDKPVVEAQQGDREAFA